jgi:hypothetical protein
MSTATLERSKKGYDKLLEVNEPKPIQHAVLPMHAVSLKKEGFGLNRIFKEFFAGRKALPEQNTVSNDDASVVELVEALTKQIEAMTEEMRFLLAQSEATSLLASQLSPKVEAFLKANGLQPTCVLATELVRKYIPGIKEIRISLQEEDLTGQFVELYIVVDTDVTSLVQADRKLRDEWFARLSSEQTELIRVNYKFVK